MWKDAPFAAAAAAYLAFVFQLGTSAFRHAGMGDWIDPYFLNYLLEHWFVSVRTLDDPTSPPMFHPVPGTLGYSHSLVLYAPGYILLRLAFHPFQAFSLMLCAVMLIGSISLYAPLRRVLRLAVVEASALTAFFVASPNVLNAWIGVWSQRASVFLIPPILLVLAAAMRLPDSRRRTIAGFGFGLLSALLLTHDFYTPVLAAIAGAVLAPAAGGVRLLHVRAQFGRSRAAHPLLVVAVAVGVWAAWVWVSGGVSTEVLGLRVSSRDWRRPGLVAGVLAAVSMYRLRGQVADVLQRVARWKSAVAAGALTGFVVFLWIHAPAFREQRGFDYQQVLNQLVVFGRSPYESLRTFAVAAVLAAAAWTPWFRVDPPTRRRITWLALGSVVVLILPMRIGDGSLWTVLYYLPGLSAVRDPKRLVYFYELGFVLVVGLLLRRLAPRSWYRRLVIGLATVAIAIAPNSTTFYYARPNATYERWVEAPVDADASCRSFFVRPASALYASRPDASWSMYHLDAMFVALRERVPTLHGYSAWAPSGWGIGNPAAPDYLDGVNRWIVHTGLTGVCELDIERRRMTPYVARSSR